MFVKTLVICMALVAAANAVQAHRADINIDKLTEEQSSVNSFIESQVDWVDGATLIGGQQEGQKFTYRYVGAELPRTIADYSVTKRFKRDDPDTDTDTGSSSYYYQLDQVVSSKTAGGLDNGKRVTTTKTIRRGSENFGEAYKLANF